MSKLDYINPEILKRIAEIILNMSNPSSIINSDYPDSNYVQNNLIPSNNEPNWNTTSTENLLARVDNSLNLILANNWELNTQALANPIKEEIQPASQTTSALSSQTSSGMFETLLGRATLGTNIFNVNDRFLSYLSTPQWNGDKLDLIPLNDVSFNSPSKIQGGVNPNTKKPIINTEAISNGLAIGATISNNIVLKVHPVENNAAYDVGMSVAKEAAKSNPYATAAVLSLDMINNLGASKAKDYKVNENIAAKQEAGYGGAYSKMRDAASRAGKSYGLISGIWGDNAGKVNRDIKKSKTLEGIISKVSDNSDAFRELALDPYASLRRNAKLYGSNDSKTFAVHKKGGTINEIVEVFEEPITSVEEILTFLEGGIIKTPRTLEELTEYAKLVNPRFILRMSEPVRDIQFKDTDGKTYFGTHRLTYETNKDGTKAYVFPEIYENENGELIYDPENASKHAQKYKDELEMSREEAELFTKHYKEMWPLFFLQFKSGGSFNVIPEGALHARLHHMDIKNVTNKGIPVVSIGEGGEILLLAEIEHSEIIFRLEVTEQIENLRKAYEQTKYDLYAIWAGKLLTNEILNNTQDRTNLLNE